jgi:hypothetical protein
LVAGLVGGCVSGPGGSTDDDASGLDDQFPAGQPEADPISVRFVNTTQAVVETEFYTTNGPIANVPGDLFDTGNLVTRGIGVAGRGLLPPATADTIELPCTVGMLVGTTGGRFEDPDLGTLLGEGVQRYVIQGAVFDCGATVTFTYKVTEAGFTTEVDHTEGGGPSSSAADP